MHKHAVYLYQTSDGGATWMLKYANDPSQPNNTLPFSGHKNGMTFRDTSTGWVGGYVPSPGAVYLYKTTNGGTSWAQQSLALPAGYELVRYNHHLTHFLWFERWYSSGVGKRRCWQRVVHLRHP